MHRLGDSVAGRHRIEADDELTRYREEQSHHEGRWDTDSSRETFEHRLRDWLAESIERDQPGLLRTKDQSLDALIAQLQEDVVVVHRAEPRVPAAQARAIYMSVNFPSGWCPDCLSGKSFLSIHAGVPVTDEFDGAGRMAAAAALFEPGDKVRFVWGLTPDNRLDRRACRREAGGAPQHETVTSSWKRSSTPWLRVERQVICPLDEQTSCFLIRVYCYAWESLNDDVRARIRSSISTMPASVREYKGLSTMPELP